MFNIPNLYFLQMQVIFVQLKRILTILLAFVYLLVSSGLIMELHHCMGKISGSSVSLFGSLHSDKCGNCGMEDKKSDCCKDEVKLVKIQDAQKQVSADYATSVPPIAEADISSPFLAFDIFNDNRVVETPGHHPPLISQPPRCILHCVFRL